MANIKIEKQQQNSICLNVWSLEVGFKTSQQSNNGQIALCSKMQKYQTNGKVSDFFRLNKDIRFNLLIQMGKYKA